MNKIPMLDLASEYDYLRQEIDAALARCLSHQQWIFGPEVKEFEAAAAGYLNAPHCVGVSSGTEALVLVLRAYAIQRTGREFFSKDDEIITTPFTFTATGDAILRSGATPVFVDIDPVTCNIDHRAVRDYIDSPRGSRVVGILPVHLYGCPAEMDALCESAAVRGAFVLEDVAQAFGAEWKKQKTGTVGDAGAFSFFPSKNLGSFGDAGLVATRDPKITELVRMLLKHGGKDKYNVDHIGYNGRMDTIQAAVLLAKLKHIDEFTRRRQSVAALYHEMLPETGELLLPDMPAQGSTHVFHQYTVRSRSREALQAFLSERGVSSMIYYPVPLHKMKVFEGRMVQAGDLSRSEAAAREVLSLPMGPLQNESDTRYAAECVNAFFQQARKRGMVAVEARVS